MRRIVTFIVILICFLFLTGDVLAADLVVRLEEPKSPTNQKDFKISFVVGDNHLDRPVEVKCFIKKPGQSFQQFDSTKNLTAPGGSGFCQVTSSQIDQTGTFEFYALAKAGSDTAMSLTVAVEYDDVGPDTPVSYSKETLPDGCSFKIKFKTADDGGETARIELYRSENPSFTADNNTKIAEQGIGSNLEGEFITSLPDCGKHYYFAIRAFDGHGNGSGIIGDVSTVSAPDILSTATSASAALPVKKSQVASPQGDLGEEGEEITRPDGEGDGQDQTEQEEVAEDTLGAQDSHISTLFKYSLLFLGTIGFLVAIFYFFKTRKD